MRFVFVAVFFLSIVTGCVKLDDLKVGDEVILRTDSTAHVAGRIKSIDADWVVVESSDGGQIHQTWLKKAAIKSVKRTPSK